MQERSNIITVQAGTTSEEIEVHLLQMYQIQKILQDRGQQAHVRRIWTVYTNPISKRAFFTFVPGFIAGKVAATSYDNFLILSPTTPYTSHGIVLQSGSWNSGVFPCPCDSCMVERSLGKPNRFQLIDYLNDEIT